MPDSVAAAPRQIPRPLIVGLAGFGVLFAATLAMWAHYGTAVFLEMIVAGIAACG